MTETVNTKLNQLIKSLRQERQECDEMLVRLDRHHKSVADGIGMFPRTFSAEVKLQGETIQHARRQTDQACQELAGVLRLNAAVPVEIMISLMPRGYQPLVAELTRENRQLMEQVAESLQRKILCSLN